MAGRYRDEWVIKGGREIQGEMVYKRVAGRYRERWFIKGGREIQGEMGYEVWQGDTSRDGSFSVDGRYR